MVSSSVVVAEEHFYPRARKLSKAQWLGAPHFQVLSKRGRFVFRQASDDHSDHSENNDVEDHDLQADKRNWRL